MGPEAWCGVAPLFIPRRFSAFQEDKDIFVEKRSKVLSKNSRKVKGSTLRRSRVVAANFIIMTELRNKILTFRDLLDLSPCIGSASVNQLLVLTLKDLYKLYPSIKPRNRKSEIERAEMHQALKYFCDAIKSIGEMWTHNDEWMVKYRDELLKLDPNNLERYALGLLEDIIKVVSERVFDMIDEDDRMTDVNASLNTFGEAFSESCSDNRSSVSSFPNTPTSILPEIPNTSAKAHSSSPLLMSLRVEAVEKLKPIDVKRLSIHMFPHVAAQESNYVIRIAKTDSTLKEQQPEVEEKVETGSFDGLRQKCDVMVESPKIKIPESEMVKENNETNLQSPVEVLPPSPFALSSKAGEPQIATPLTPPQRSPTPSQPLTSQVNPAPNFAPVQGAPPPPPPPPLPSTAPRKSVLSAPPPPPPSVILRHVEGLPTSLALPTTPRNTISPPVASENIISYPPPPPPPHMARSVTTPPVPPPPPPMTSNRAMPAPPPPIAMGKGAAPPPPPGLTGARNLRTKKATKLKRSSQMSNLYRLLKGKLEGSSLDGKSGRRGKLGPASGGKQGMADALAEMTKRSAYFQHIEEDVKNHATAIMEMKTSIATFQTSDMSELIKFHKYLESCLEKLTDESQVLSRFEDFPAKKLEALRMAAALYSKLDGIASTLQNWPIVSPVNQLLHNAENYFSKIKLDLDKIERTKDEEAEKFASHKITFDFSILVRIKELMVDVSSNCMELALKETREGKEREIEAGSYSPREGHKKRSAGKLLWKAFQFAYRVYTFAGGHDDRADKLTRELAREIETDPQP